MHNNHSHHHNHHHGFKRHFGHHHYPHIIAPFANRIDGPTHHNRHKKDEKPHYHTEPMRKESREPTPMLRWNFPKSTRR